MRALFANFYYRVKDAVLKEDGLKQFYGHVYGCLHELSRYKAAQVFKPDARKTATKKTEDKPVTGLMDGDENLTLKLQKNHKFSEVINQVNTDISVLLFSLHFLPECPEDE